MNRLSFRRRRYQNGLVQSGAGVAAVVITVLILVLIIIRLAAPTFWYNVTAPMWRGGASLGLQTQNVVGESKTTLRAERDDNEQKVAALTTQNAALAAQVVDLTKLLGTRTEPAPGVLARVLARPPVAPYDVLIIDQGTNEGVTLGARVTGNGGTPIGTIGQADASQSRVTLFSTHGIQSAGWAGNSRIPVTLTGEGAGAFAASVPKAAGVQIGDGVYLASASAVPVGTVTAIESDPSSPTVNLDVRPYANPFSLMWVAVERP